MVHFFKTIPYVAIMRYVINAMNWLHSYPSELLFVAWLIQTLVEESQSHHALLPDIKTNIWGRCGFLKNCNVKVTKQWAKNVIKVIKRGISSIKTVAAVQNSLWWITNIFMMKIWKNTEMKLTWGKSNSSL